jgi:hypothetical protein
LKHIFFGRGLVKLTDDKSPRVVAPR